MVMATETRETNRNGKSRGSSPNTNIHHVHNTNSTKVPPTTAEGLTPETSDDDSHSKKNLHSSKHEKNKNGKNEYEEKIRVGKDYQVIPPEYHSTRPDIYPDKALLVWSPVKDIPDSKLEEYISLAKETYGYNAEQALGMLFWHKHDLEKAVQDLANFTPFPDEWTKEDKVLFEQAFQFHGKSFYRIRQMLPDKTIASLVKFYYSWKKTRSRTSVMDRHEKKKAEGGSENGSEHGGSPEDSDIEDKDSKRLNAVNGRGTLDLDASSSLPSVTGSGSLNCQNCTVLCDELKQTTVGSFCTSCFNHWRRTGVLRPTCGPHQVGPNSRPRSKANKLYYYHDGYHDSSNKHKRKPPKGMFINHDDIRKLATQDLAVHDAQKKIPASDNNCLLIETDRKIGVLLSQIQKNKAELSSAKLLNSEFHDGRLPIEIALNRVNSRWTNDEMLLTVKGYEKFGSNYQAIAEVLGTKTESHVRKFLTSAKYRKNFNLDSVPMSDAQELLQDKSTMHDGTKQFDSVDIMEIDSDDETTPKDNGTIENIEEIIGVNPPSSKDFATPTKTSIMTTSTGKTLKRKHPENEMEKIDTEKVLILDDDDDSEPEPKKMSTINVVKEFRSEITLTPIPKMPVIASGEVENKIKAEDSAELTVTTVG